MNWNKPNIEATKHRHILAVMNGIDEDGDNYQIIDVLTFDGIRNRFCMVNGTERNIMLNEISFWIPLPAIPNKNDI